MTTYEKTMLIFVVVGFAITFWFLIEISQVVLDNKSTLMYLESLLEAQFS